MTTISQSCGGKMSDECRMETVGSRLMDSGTFYKKSKNLQKQSLMNQPNPI